MKLISSRFAKKAGRALLFASIVGLSSCYNDPSFSDTPVIYFKSISKVTTNSEFGGKADSVTIAIDFRDGNGDLGLLDPEDTTHNYLLRLFIKRNGAFEEVIRQTVDTLGKPIRLDYQRLNFPLKNDGKAGPIEGTLYYSLSFSYSLPIAPPPSVPAINTTPNNDVIQFKVRIVDRAGNVSNEITTDTLVINQRK